MATTAILALTAAGTPAGSHPGLAAKATGLRSIQSGGATLYSQNSNFGYGIVSQNFTSGSLGTAYNAAGADDFVVPQGKSWTITGVDVSGVYFKGSGPAASETITFYTNSNGTPGQVVGRPKTVICSDSSGSFACRVKAILSGGKKGRTYWVSVVANMSFASGEWGWVQNTVGARHPGKWENPGGGFGTGCSTWTDTSICIPAAGADDFAFGLKGKSN
jgi:hypothetical protein